MNSICTSPMRTLARALGTLLLACAGVAAAAAPPELPMQQLVDTRLIPQLDELVGQLDRDQAQMKLDGVAVFRSGDKFLPGKIALGLSDLIGTQGAGRHSQALQGQLRGFRRIADLTVGMKNETWGIYYYLLALNELNRAGLLDQAVSPATLERLKKQLDWRRFVQPQDLTLIHLPANYYGVAFGVARLRFLLGWEEEASSQRLLSKMLDHYRRYSGAFGFSDETDGEGRFDRYSILLIAEICERFMETGLAVTDELKAMLRKSVDVALLMANPRGDGFSYGRSLGPYADTAPLEILSVAAALNVLSPEEKTYAYAYSTRIVAKYADFWFDPAIHSVDMWNHGRRTDRYRNKDRILGENFSLLHQLIVANARWNLAGCEGRVPAPDLPDWAQRTQPAFKLVWFARGEYERALAVIRQGRTDKTREVIFSLPLINGGAGQFANDPYYPVPFAQQLVAGTPDSDGARPQLLPEFELADGTKLLGTSFIQNIKADDDGDGGEEGKDRSVHRVSYSQDRLARLGQPAPVGDPRITLETVYRFEAGRVIRSDRYTPSQPLRIRRLSLDFASFSTQAQVDGLSTRFGTGRVQRFAVSGLDRCELQPASADDQSPEGPMPSHIACEKLNFDMRQPLTVSWTLDYH